jgi:hypothetical protein
LVLNNSIGRVNLKIYDILGRDVIWGTWQIINELLYSLIIHLLTVC